MNTIIYVTNGRWSVRPYGRAVTLSKHDVLDSILPVSYILIILLFVIYLHPIDIFKLVYYGSK